jgi:glycosyltransferase involved in cell wall biosynthesis
MPRRIAMIEPLGDGGITHYTYNLMGALSCLGACLSLITTAKYEFKEESHSYSVYPVLFSIASKLTSKLPSLDEETPRVSMIRRGIKMIEYPLNLIRVGKIIRRGRIGTVHLQSVNWIDVLLVLLLRWLRVSVVYTIHNVLPTHGKLRFYHRSIFALTYRLCDRLIIHTEAGREKVNELFHLSRSKISVIPHGDYRFFVSDQLTELSQAKEALGIPSDTRTILFFGAIRPNKGLDQAFEVLRLLRTSGKRILLMVVGELCEDYRKYAQMIEKWGLRASLYEEYRYIPTEQVHRYFAAAEIVFLPYYEITQSGVLQIAYAFGKAVIASDLDGFRESIEEGKNGFLVRIGDFRKFAERITTLLDDGMLLQKMGKHSMWLAQEKFAWEGIAKATLELYAGA